MTRLWPTELFLTVFNYITFSRFIVDNGGSKREDSDTDFSSDVWFHVALVFDATSREMIGYQNGVEVARDDDIATGEEIYEDDGRFVIGKHYAGYNEDSSSVTVDDLMFYDRPLSGEDIRAIATFYT